MASSLRRSASGGKGAAGPRIHTIIRDLRAVDASPFNTIFRIANISNGGRDITFPRPVRPSSARSPHPLSTKGRREDRVPAGTRGPSHARKLHSGIHSATGLTVATTARTTRFCRTRNSLLATGFSGGVHPTGKILARRTISAVRPHVSDALTLSSQFQRPRRQAERAQLQATRVNVRASSIHGTQHAAVPRWPDPD
jgi:hypothetical protein